MRHRTRPRATSEERARQRQALAILIGEPLSEISNIFVVAGLISLVPHPDPYQVELMNYGKAALSWTWKETKLKGRIVTDSIGVTGFVERSNSYAWKIIQSDEPGQTIQDSIIGDLLGNYFDKAAIIPLVNIRFWKKLDHSFWVAGLRRASGEVCISIQPTWLSDRISFKRSAPLMPQDPEFTRDIPQFHYYLGCP
jgi:hypothetical protein